MLLHSKLPTAQWASRRQQAVLCPASRGISSRRVPAPLAAASAGRALEEDYYLRKGEAGDKAVIEELIRKEWMNPLGLTPERFTVAVADPERPSDSALRQGTGMKTADGNEILGFGQLELRKMGTHGVHGGEWELRSLVVVPGARGKGIGSAIIGELQGRCGDGDRVVLLTLKSTTKFYQRLGFKELPGSEVPGYLKAEALAGSVVARLAGHGELAALSWQAKGHTTTGHTPLHAKRPHPQMPSWATNGKRN